MHKIFTVDYSVKLKDGKSSDRIANILARSPEAAKAGLVRKLKWHFDTVKIQRIKSTNIDLVLDN